MIIQSLLLIGLFLGTCDISASSTPPNQKARPGRGGRPKGTPRPPRASVSESGADADASAQPGEADGKAQEAARQVAASADVSEQDVQKLMQKKSKIVGNGTLDDIKAGMLDLQAKLAAAEKELRAERMKTSNLQALAAASTQSAEVANELARTKAALRAKEGEFAQAQEELERVKELQLNVQKQYDTLKRQGATAAEDVKRAAAERAAEIEQLREQIAGYEREAKDNRGLDEAARELKDKHDKAEATIADLRKAVDAAEQRAKAAAEKAADLARDLAAKEAEFKNAQETPAKNKDADKEEAIHRALADLDKKYQAAQEEIKKSQDAAADAKRKLDEADADSDLGDGKSKRQGAMRKERDNAQANAKFYKNIGMTAVGALAVGGGVLLWRTLTGGPRLATRVKADEMISFITHYEGPAQELVTTVVKTFGEPAKSDRAMYVKLNEKLVQSIDLLEEFLSWKSEPVSQEFVEAEDALLRLLIVRTALLKLMPMQEPVAENEAAVAA